MFTPNSLRQVKELRAGKFEPQFQIFFCDDVEDLMKHYFHDFTAEGVAEPYRLYTGSWRTPTTVKYFGLSEDTLHSDSGFVLVKLQKPRLTVRTEGEPKLMPEAAREFSKIRIGDEESVKSFTEDFGSHYIRSLTVGDAVYQILALDRSKYMRARQEVLVERIKVEGKLQQQQEEQENGEVDGNPLTGNDSLTSSVKEPQTALTCGNCNISFVNPSTYSAHVQFYCKKKTEPA